MVKLYRYLLHIKIKDGKQTVKLELEEYNVSEPTANAKNYVIKNFHGNTAARHIPIENIGLVKGSFSDSDVISSMFSMWFLDDLDGNKNILLDTVKKRQEKEIEALEKRLNQLNELKIEV